jgi:predicted hydrocarbon binding protein
MTEFRDRLVFDAERGEYRDGAIRYMMIRPDALMGIIAEMPEPVRGHAMEAFGRSIRRFGGHSARAYRDAGADDLLATIEATAPQLGWGRWRLTRVEDGLALAVENSPFAAGAGASAHPVCAPIRGMLTAIGEMLLGEVAVAETACAAMGAPCCTFKVRAAPRVAATAAPSP